LESIKDNLSEEIRALICKLSDINHCSVVCSANGEIEEIHALAGINRNVKQLVRDIQSAISARFGINIDYKIISIAQVNENDFREVRLQINGTSVRNAGNSIEAVVMLGYDNKIYEGKSTRVKSRNNKFKAIAEAALQALESYLNVEHTLYVEDIRIVPISRGELCSCVIGYVIDGKEELLTGCCLISGDENDAAVKAVLSAVNRRLSTIS